MMRVTIEERDEGQDLQQQVQQEAMDAQQHTASQQPMTAPMMILQ